MTGQNTISTRTIPPEARRVVLALLIGGIAAILSSTMVTLAIQTLSHEFHVGTGTVQWVTTGYLLAMAVSIPLSGWMESRWGGKRSWMLALLGFSIGSLLCGFSWNLGSLIAFRVVQGFAAGLIYPLMQTLAIEAAHGDAGPRLIAAISMPIALGPIIGPVTAGLLLHWLSWRWLFYVNVPLGGIGLLLAHRLIPNDTQPARAAHTHLDVPGLIVLTLGLVGILLGLSQLSEDGGLGHPDVLIPLVGGMLFLAGFIVWALHPGTHPVVNIRLLGTRSLGSASAVLFCVGATMYAALFLLPLFYQGLQGRDVLAVGLLMIPQGVGALAARWVAGTLTERFGARTVTLGSFLLTAAATIPFAVATATTNTWWLGLALFVRGLGVGTMLIPPMAVAYKDISRAALPDATMATRIIQQVGSSFGTAIVAVVLQSLLQSGTTAAFHTAFWWTTGIALVAALVSWTLPAEHSRP